MPDLGSIVPSLAIALLLVVMLWFTFGTQRNVRTGNELLRWLQAGLPLLGPRTSLRWLGSSAVELRLSEAAAPFRDATVVVVLEPRDVGLLWAWSRARGRRDFLIFRANLRRAPRGSIEVVDRRGWTGRRSGDRGDGEGGSAWHRIEWPGGTVEADATDGVDETAVREAWKAIEAASGGLWKLAVQPVVPHLEIHVVPPPPRVRSDRLIRPIRELATALARPAA